MAELVTIKVTQNARTMLRLLAAHSGAEMCAIAEDLAWAEMKRRKIEPSAILKKAKARQQKNGQPEN